MLLYEHELERFPQYESLSPVPTNETTGEYGCFAWDETLQKAVMGTAETKAVAERMKIGINLLYLLPGVVGGTETYAAGLVAGVGRNRPAE